MKRYGDLWPQITSFENLLLSARKAQRGKRFRDNVLAFNDRLETNLLALQTQLQTQSYQPGAYRTFEIFEPKPRIISAAPYPDRVVHHALCTIIAPLFERTFIHDSYANRIGYGTHRALHRFTHYCRSQPYILQADIRKYFPNIDHTILKALIRRKIKCPQTLWLIDQIIDNSHHVCPHPSPLPEGEGTRVLAPFSPGRRVGDEGKFPGDDSLPSLERPRGLPIGNLTSQFFANVYLNGFDHFVTETLRVPYLRYVDDFALFSGDRAFLADARLAIEAYLSTLRLQLHPAKTQLSETRHGASFVGFRVLPDRIRVRSDNLRRARLRFQRLRRAEAQGHRLAARIESSRQSWLAHLKHGDTWRLRQKIESNPPIIDQAVPCGFD
jgi:retron-type reverse transcriptase